MADAVAVWVVHGRREREDLDALARMATQAGFVSRGVELGAPSLYEESPHELADAMARRSHSSLWSVGAERWQGVVEPAIARLRALGPAPVPRVKREWLLVLERR